MKISSLFKSSEREAYDRKGRPSAAGREENREKAFLDHFRTHYAWMGLPFDRYLPAYRYAESMAEDGGLAGLNWQDVETEFRQNWELSYPGTWSRFRDAIYFGWEKVRR